MKRFVSWALSSLAILIAGELAATDQPVVTIYNSNLGLVQETRTLELTRGRQVLSVTDVAEHIQPATVHLESSDFSVLEQNFQYDLVNASKVFTKYIGEIVTLELKSDEVVTGKLLSNDNNLLMLQDSDGSLRMLNSENIREYTFPELPEGLFLRPTLQWIVDSSHRGESDVRISYLTGGMSWEAEYILLMEPEEDEATLSSWVTLRNNSGAPFKNARIKLVAGDIHRAAGEGRGPERADMNIQTLARQAPVTERQVFEYYVYEIDFPTDLNQNAMKQVMFRNPTEISTERVYSFEHSERQSVKNENVTVQITFENSKENNLGVALPAGVIRLMQRDDDGSEILVGEDRIQHTPTDEEVRLEAGRAFDVVGDRSIANIERRSDNYERLTVRISLRNHKKQDVTVQVRENFYGDWEILRETHQSDKIDATTLEYTARIPAKGEVEIEYTIERRR